MTTDVQRLAPLDPSLPAFPTTGLRSRFARVFRRVCEGRMRAALSMMSDSELMKIGMTRADIPRVAAEAMRRND